MNEKKDDQINANFIIEQLQKLLNVHKKHLEEWENSPYRDTNYAKDMIKTLQESIKEVEDEIESYEEYKKTGVLITGQARKLLQEVREKTEKNREDDGLEL